MKVIGYLRVSTAEQGESKLGLEAQKAILEAMAPIRGWELVGWETDVASGGMAPSARPALTRALRAVQAHQADALAVAKLDRIARSTIDTLTLMQRAHREGWDFIALDLHIDTSTNDGRLVATVFAAIGEWERGRIGERVREALAARKARGLPIGRQPGSHDKAMKRRVHALRGYGSLRQISAKLAEDGVVGRTGRPLTAAQVARLLAA